MAVIVAMTSALPWALWTFTTFPIRSVPTWEELQDLPSRAATDTFLVGVCIVGLWVAWLIFTISFIHEAFAELRGRQATRLRLTGPFQFAARRLIASVVMTLGSLGSGSHRVSASPPPTPIAVTALADTVMQADVVESRSTEVAERPVQINWHWVTVGQHDSAWDIAEHFYGDGTLANRLWEDNQHRPQPDGGSWSDEAQALEPGWRIRLRQDKPGPHSEGEAESVTVEPGDSLWSMAEDRLTDHLGRESTPEETDPYWRATVDENVAGLASGDPNLIYPGEEIVLPSPASKPSEPPDLPSPHDPEVPAEPPPTTEPPAAETPTTATPTTEPTAPSTSSTKPAAPEARAAEADDDEDVSVGRVIAPLGVSAALATLTLLALARRRRARRRAIKPHATFEPRLEEDITVEMVLSAGAGDVLDLAWRAVRALKEPLQQLDNPPTVTGLVVAANGDVTVLLSEPITPRHPFLPHRLEPSGWLLPADYAEAPAEGEEPIPILQTLVSIGRTVLDEWVFLDLESLGAVWLDGDREAARRLASSIASELVMKPFDHIVYVTVAGDIEMPEAAEQGGVKIEADGFDESHVRTLERSGQATRESLAMDHMPTTPKSRAHAMPVDGTIPSVYVIAEGADKVLLNRAARAALPGDRGLAIVALDPLDSPAFRMIVDQHGQIHLPHLGITATAAALDRDDLERIENLIEREPVSVRPAAPPVEEPVIPAAQLEEGSVAPYEEPDWEYCVRVFSDLQVETQDGQTISFQVGHNEKVHNTNTRRGPELLAFLALQPERAATLDDIADAMWSGKTIKRSSVNRLVSGTRRVLGSEDHLTPQDRVTRMYTLMSIVTTDFELLGSAVAYARAMAEHEPILAFQAIRPRLARIDAKPFREGALGEGLMEWAQSRRQLDRIDGLVVEAGLLAAQLAADSQDHGLPTAIWALDQALKATPTNEMLIRAAMELDALNDNRAAADRRYQALCMTLTEDELEPEEETTEVRRRIMRPTTRIG